MDDFLSTTAVVTYVRRHVTPKGLWYAVGALITALMGSITWIVTTRSDIRELTNSVAESKRSVSDMQGQLDLLHKIDTQIAVMGSKVDTIADEVERQREWRDRIEGIAESPPHASRRRR